MKIYKNIFLYFNTIKYLRFKQIYFRIYKYFKINFINQNTKYNLRIIKKNFEIFIYKEKTLSKYLEFNLFNKNIKIKDKFDWIKNQNKLILYNLNYFDFLNSQKNTNNKIYNEIIFQWIKDNPLGNEISWDPYPTSLRIVNIIKYLLRTKQTDKRIIISLIFQTRFLYNNIEYHLLGNHIIANAKSLIFSGLFFHSNESEDWLKKGKMILLNEIKEQILSDGGHFERSPMYHSIILEDLLDIYNLAVFYDINIENHIIKKNINQMLNWLFYMSHPDQKLSFFNDTTNNVSANFTSLSYYSDNLNIKSIRKEKDFVEFQNSGYSIIRSQNYHCIIDRADLGPDYNPGHGHADTLSFELSVFKKRLIVNSGISTYEDNKTRKIERGTISHSTLLVDNKNSSEIWKSFRVASRARIINKKNYIKNNCIKLSASHTGYKRLKKNIIHNRSWVFYKNKIYIIDDLYGNDKRNIKVNYLLHPSVKIIDVNRRKKLIQLLVGSKKVFFLYPDKIYLNIKKYYYNYSFGKRIISSKIELEINKVLPERIESSIFWND